MHLLVCVALLGVVSAQTNSSLDSGMQMIAEMAASNGSQVEHILLSTKNGTLFNETLIEEKDHFRKAIVTTKDGEEQIFIEDCKNFYEFIVPGSDPDLCYYHKLTEEERVRSCEENLTSVIEETGDFETEDGNTEEEEGILTDAFSRDESSDDNESLDVPKACLNKTLVHLKPEIIGKEGGLDLPDSDERAKRYVWYYYYYCHWIRTWYTYCYRYCYRSSWWGTRRYCCHRITTWRTVRWCGYRLCSGFCCYKHRTNKKTAEIDELILNDPF